MVINIIAYPPGAGGNHLKNLVGLNGDFQRQWPWAWIQQYDRGLTPYDNPTGVPGEVHSLHCRNIHEVFFDHIDSHPHGRYLLHGHFGELAPYANRIRSWSKVQWLVVTMDEPQDRTLLRARQNRLQYHPYWEDEEQIYLYRAEMYQNYFGADYINLLSISQIWDPDLDRSGVLAVLSQAFEVHIPADQAKTLHQKWQCLNFPAGSGFPS
jgi:hypothetical protein